MPACQDGGFQAIALTNGSAIVDPWLCDGCALCVSVCNLDAITLVRGRA